MAVLVDPKDIYQWNFAVDILKKGEPVVLPTETVYGLAAPALREDSLAKIFHIKDRPTFDPLIVHVLSGESVKDLSLEITPLHRRLYSKFWPGPLTLLFKKTDKVPDLCTSGSEWVAVRSPSHVVFRRALEQVGVPLAAPSANRFGRISPTSALAAVQELGPRGVEVVVDGGDCFWGLESTVVKIVGDNSLEVLRPGALSIEAIMECVGDDCKISVREEGHGMQMESPGLTESHYAPENKKLFFVENFDEVFASLVGRDLQKTVLVAVYSDLVSQKYLKLNWGRVEILSESGNDLEAAAKVFRILRELDHSEMQDIFVLKCADKGLGRAINDRFKRASQKFGIKSPASPP